MCPKIQVSSTLQNEKALFWSCRSSLTCKIWSYCIFLLDLTRRMKKLHSIGQRKENNYPRILILFFPTARLVNSSTLIFFLILISWNTKKLKWQYDHTIINANFSTVIFWVWINHPVPTFDLTFNQLCPITHHSHSSWCYSALLQS